MSVPVRMTLGEFLALRGMLWGEIHVSERVPGRKGARRGNRHKGTESRTSLAGPGDGDGPTDGGSATSSVARSSDRAKYAGSADGQGEEPKRALIPGGGRQGESGGVEELGNAPAPTKELPRTLWDLIKAVNEKEQIVPVISKLLGSEDEKTKLRMVELIMKTGYSENAPSESAGHSSFVNWNIRD